MCVRDRKQEDQFIANAASRNAIANACWLFGPTFDRLSIAQWPRMTHAPKAGPQPELRTPLRIPSYNHIDVRPQNQWLGITHALTELNGPKPGSISWPVQPECCQKLLQISFRDSHAQKDSARDVVIIALSENYSCKISQCYSATCIFSWILFWGILLYSFHMGKMALSWIYIQPFK